MKSLDEAGLRARIELLAKEFESRSKVEALKLSQSLSQQEAETSNKYLRLMLQQRSGVCVFIGVSVGMRVYICIC